jgi:hypothetical protein
LGFPLLLGDLDFFLKLGLKDNLGFVGLIREGEMVLWIGCFFWLSGVSMGLFVVVWVLFSPWFPWVPITMGSKSCGFGKGVG